MLQTSCIAVVFLRENISTVEGPDDQGLQTWGCLKEPSLEALHPLVLPRQETYSRHPLQCQHTVLLFNPHPYALSWLLISPQAEPHAFQVLSHKGQLLLHGFPASPASIPPVQHCSHAAIPAPHQMSWTHLFQADTDPPAGAHCHRNQNAFANTSSATSCWHAVAASSFLHRFPSKERLSPPPHQLGPHTPNSSLQSRLLRGLA